MPQEINSLRTRTQFDVIPDGPFRRGSYLFAGRDYTSPEKYWLGFAFGSTYGQFGGSMSSLNTASWARNRISHIIKLNHNRLFQYPAIMNTRLTAPIPYSRDSYRVTLINPGRYYYNCQSKYDVAIYQEGTQYRIVFPIPKTATIFKDTFFSGVGVGFYVRRADDPGQYVYVILGDQVAGRSSNTQTTYEFSFFPPATGWADLGITTPPAVGDAIIFECLPAMQPYPLFERSGDITSTAPAAALSGSWILKLSNNQDVMLRSTVANAVVKQDDSQDGNAVAAYAGFVAPNYEVHITGTLSTPPVPGDFFISKEFKGKVATVTSVGPSTVLQFNEATNPIYHNSAQRGSIIDWFISGSGQVTNIYMDATYDAVKYDYRVGCVETGDFGAYELNSYVDESLGRRFPILLHSFPLAKDIDTPYFLGGNHRTYIPTYTVAANTPPKVLAAPLDGDLALRLYSPLMTNNITNLSIIPQREALEYDPILTDVEEVVRQTNAVSNAIPRGVCVLFDGQFAPMGYKEVVGETFEGSDGTYGIPPQSAVEIPTPDAQSVLYDKTTDITEIRLEYPITGYPAVLFEEDEYFDWNVQHKEVDIPMLPEPDPSNIKVSIPFLWTKIEFSLGALPKASPRPQRKAMLPIGKHKPKWMPGSQLFRIIDKAFTNTWSAEVKSDLITNRFFAATISSIEINHQDTYKEAPTITGTYPLNFPSSFIEHSALIVKHIISKWAGKWGRKVGKAIEKWATKSFGRKDPLPDLIVDTSSTTVFIRLLGNFKDMIPSILVDPGLFILKTGYVKHDPNNAGGHDWGSPEHNHVVADLNNLQNLQVPIAFTNADGDDFFEQDDASRKMMPPACKNHGHDYLGEGSYNRPPAHVLKVCVKI